jgi:hypothetical protein
MNRLPPSEIALIGVRSWGVRTISNVDVVGLRPFLLSVLWRCAASKSLGFEEIQIGSDELEVLREMVLNGKTSPIEHFPVILIQLSIMGMRHNNSPVKATMTYAAIESDPQREDELFRFYFDGLVIHIGTRMSDFEKVARQGRLALGSSPDLYVMTVAYEDSLQRNNIETIRRDAELNWKSQVDKIWGF